jgi:glycosyltransferase involved in cell wall biosynthesis
MKIVAVLQLWNELEKGNLIRCLDNVKQWADQIVIYDDGSTDGSQHVYEEYTTKDLMILSDKNEFANELFHKQEMLELALKLDPDWIGWTDGDAIFDREATYDLPGVIDRLETMGGDAAYFHNVNLWKSESWYRVDNAWDGLDHVCLWKNNGSLHYDPVAMLHQNQYPRGLNKILHTGNRLLHYGFTSREKIVEKYLRYRACGQRGWELDRFLDERTSYMLLKADEDWYPDDALLDDFDDDECPVPETYEGVR